MNKPPINILVLEDNKDDVFLMQKTLQRYGLRYNMTLAFDKKEFSDALDTQAFDLVLADHQLEEFDCLEALKLCREKGQTIPVILVTGMVPESVAKDIKAKGIDDYVLKKDIRRLPEVIKGVLS